MGCRIVLIVNLIINVSLPRHPLSERGDRRPGCVAPSVPIAKKLKPEVCHTVKPMLYVVFPSALRDFFLWPRFLQGLRCAPPLPVILRPFRAKATTSVL